MSIGIICKVGISARLGTGRKFVVRNMHKTGSESCSHSNCLSHAGTTCGGFVAEHDDHLEFDVVVTP